MPKNFAQYRVDDDDENGPELWNKILRDIDNRIASIEDKLPQLDVATEALIQRGLDQLNSQLQATIQTIQTDVAAAAETVASLQTALVEVQQNITDAVAALETSLDDDIATVQAAVDAAIAEIDDTLGDLEAAIADIISGGTLPASGITVAAIAGVAGDDVQEVLEEFKTDIEAVEDDVATLQDDVTTLQGDVSTLQDQVNGIGDIKSVADYTEAATLTGLDKGDIIHVLNNGSSKWIRYQVTGAGDGTWAGCTKVVIFTQDQQPADHVHVIDDITGLQTALDGKAAASHTQAISTITGLQTALDGKQAADADILKADVSDNLTVGFTATSYNAGTKSSGTFTPAFATRGVQHFTNNGAFTLAAPTGEGSMVLDQVNGASAGVITMSFDFVTGDDPSTVNAEKFRHFITVGNNGSHIHTVAMQ